MRRSNPHRISLDQRRHVALEARNVNIADTKRGIEIDDVRSVRIGLATLPLLRGDMRVERLELDGANIRVTSQVPFDFMSLVPMDDQGLVNLMVRTDVIFAGLEGAVSLLDQRETRDITISDTSFDFTVAGEPERLRIVKLDLSETGGPVAIKGTVEWRGKESRGLRPGQSGRRSVPRLRPFRWRSANPLSGKFGVAPVPDMDGIKPDGAYLAYDNQAEVKLDGTADTTSEPARIRGTIKVGRAR